MTSGRRTQPMAATVRAGGERGEGEKASVLISLLIEASAQGREAARVEFLSIPPRRVARLATGRSAAAAPFEPAHSLVLDIPCSPSASTTAPTRCAPSSSAAPTARNSAVASSTIPAAQQGVLLDPNDHHLARQIPGDYLVGLERASGRARRRRRSKPASTRRRSSASASTPPARARSRSTREPAARARPEVEGQPLRAVLAVEGPHRLARGRAASPRSPRKHPPAVHRQMRRHLFVGMVLVEDLALPRPSRPTVFDGGLFLGRARRLGSRRCSPA